MMMMMMMMILSLCFDDHILKNVYGIPINFDIYSISDDESTFFYKYSNLSIYLSIVNKIEFKSHWEPH